MISPFLNTIWVCFGTAALASALGLILAILVVCLRVPFYRWMSTLVLSLILIPLYVQATAWSAGFGVQGWFRLSQVSAAISPITAIGSVVWIHAMAATPLCFLFSAVGLRRAVDSNSRQALLDFGPWYALFRVLIPRSWPWISAGAVWCVAMTGNDMVVTNLFQVPTITESLYQQVQFNDLNVGTILQAGSFAISIGVLVFAMAWNWIPDLGSESAAPFAAASHQAFVIGGIARWIGSLLGCVIVSLVALIPLVSLVTKAGWVATMNDDVVRRSWSPWVVIESMLQSSSFSSEIVWSIQLSLYATALATLLAVMVVGCVRRRWSARIAMGLAAFLLAVPGPLVNLTVIYLFDRSEPEWFGLLADRTLIAPILAQQSRCFPILFAVLWIASVRYGKRNERQLQVDQGLPFLTRSWIRVLAMKNPIMLATCVSFFVSFADLSSYLLVQPPQVTTVAMRMFDLLHYGIRNRESGLALTLAIAGSIPTLFLVRRFAID